MYNCVGWANYRFFFLYLLWLFVGALYSSAMSFLYLQDLKNRSLAYPCFLLSCVVVAAMASLLRCVGAAPTIKPFAQDLRVTS
jgi:hypothetical protein